MKTPIHPTRLVLEENGDFHKSPKGMLFMDPLNGQFTDLSGVRILRCGVDTVRQLYNGKLRPEVMALFDLSVDVVEFAGYEWSKGRIGRDSGYQYRVAFEEADDHFLADPRDLHRTPALPGPGLGHANPAGAVLVRLVVAIPVEVHLDPAVLVGPDLLALGSDHHRGLRTPHHRYRSLRQETERLAGVDAVQLALELRAGAAAAGFVEFLDHPVFGADHQVLAVLAGAFMTTGGVARRLIDFANACVGHIRGGLAIAAVLACMLFAALSGSSPATVAAVGSIAVAGMVRSGYPRAFGAGIICNAGTLGILIPPSIVMVVYAAATETSVGKLFIAGVVPGLLLGLILMVVIYIVARVKKWRPGL